MTSPPSLGVSPPFDDQLVSSAPPTASGGMRRSLSTTLLAAVGGATRFVAKKTLRLVGLGSPDPVTPNVRDRMNDALRARCNEYLKAEELKLRICTWNVANKSPPSDLRPWLLDKDNEVADVVVVGLQEVEFGGAALMLEVTDASVSWMEAITDCLNAAHPGVRYKKVDIAQLVGIVIVMVARVELHPQVRHVKKSVTRSGAISGVMGNKGAIGLRASICGKRFLFVSAHFHAHDGKVQLRNSNYHAALAQLKFDLPGEADDEMDVAGMFLSSSPTLSKVNGQNVFSRLFRMRPRQGTVAAKELNQLESHDYVFFFGDLNYRLNDVTRDDVLESIERGTYKKLLAHDQLLQAISAKEVFAGFEEMLITFPPTYKFDVGSVAYDTGPKRRTPAWTDRILFHTLQPLRRRRGSAQPFAPARLASERRLRKTFSAPTEFDDTTESGLSGRSGSDSDLSQIDCAATVRPKCASSGVRNMIVPLAYDSATLLTSDHRPVSASFAVHVVSHDMEQLNRVLFEVKESLGIQDECDDDHFL